MVIIYETMTVDKFIHDESAENSTDSVLVFSREGVWKVSGITSR